MANTVGEAVIRIVGDSRAFDRTLNNLGRSTSRALERGTQGLVARANVVGREFGERLGASASRWLRRGLVVGAAGVAAVVGGTLARGFKRFTTIQDATASLTLLLGDAAKAGDLLAKTLKVVEGTPFGLDQFVDAARNLAAANVDLDKIPRVLTAIADGAAAAGGSAEDVDTVVSSFARLATGAELTLGPIRELEDKGVPALRILANQAGKSTTQMAKDISAGTVESKKAIDDLTEGILNGTDGIAGATRAYGGAAQLLGEQVSGAWSNVLNAVSRAGEKIIKVFADGGKGGNALVRVLKSVRATIDILGDRAVVAAKKFVGSDGFGKVLTFFEELPAKVKSEGLVKAVVDGIEKGLDRTPADALGRVFAKLIAKGIEGISRYVPLIVASVIKASPAIIAGIAQGLLKAAADNPLNMGLFIVALGLPGIGPALTGFFRLLPFGSIVAPLIGGIGRAITAGFGAIGLTAAFQALGAKIALEFSLLGTRIGLAVLGMSAGVAAALSAALAAIAGVALGVLLHQVIEKFMPGVNRALEDGGAAIFDFFVDHVFPFFTKTIPNFFTQTIPAIVDQVAGFFGELGGDTYDAITLGFNTVIEWFQQLPDRIREAIGDLWDRFFEVGRNILNAIKEGAMSILTDSSWGKFWGDVGANAYDAVTGALNISSPSKLFMGVGRNIVEGIVVGVEQSQPRLHATLSRLVPVNDIDLSASVRGGDGGSSPVGAPPAGHTFHITEAGDGRATAERVVNRLAVG